MLISGKTRLSNGQVAALALMVVTVSLVGTWLSWVSRGSPAAVATALSAALGLMVGAVGFRLWAAQSALDVTMDESGLRVTGDGPSEYVPLSMIEGASFSSMLGRAVLTLHTASGKRRLPLAAAHTSDVQAIVDACLALSRGAAPTAAAAPAHRAGSPLAALLARSAQPLDVWLSRVRDAATGDAYREQAVDIEALTGAAEDRGADLELRAAAAHAVVWSRDEERTARVMAVAGPKAPPLLIVATTLATAAGSYVAGFEAALDYLPAGDREIALRMTDERPQRR